MRLFYLYFFALFFSSCISNKNLEYVQSKDPFEISSVDDSYILQNGDLLSVQISTTTEQIHDFFNKEATNNSQLLVQNPYLYGYLINNDGFLDLPSLGKVKAAGFTIRDLESKIKDIAVSYFEQPVVKLNIINFEVTILGDVKNPGTYNIKNSKTNIFYALSLAGDLNLTANRKKIKIIRNNTSSKKMFYVDLTSKDILTSNMMLESNDIIYVAPLRKRFYAVNSITNIISLSISAVSLYLLISNK
tara:strand:- start:1469 stop:2206 length:738 start_codon:yes stop_codon:yes gene_type:complete